MTGRGCSVDGCERGHYARGLCKLHYEWLVGPCDCEDAL